MKNLYEDIEQKWKNQRCVGSCIIMPPYRAEDLIAQFVNKMFQKNANIKIIIIVDNYGTRCNVINACKNISIDTDYLTVLSYQYIKNNIDYKYDVAFYVGLKSYDEANHIAIRVKYNLFIVNNNKINAKNLSDIYIKFPCVNEADFDSLVNGRILRPVEEHRISVSFSNNADKEQYDKLTTYITESINIFGTFENIAYARLGNKTTGQSAESVRQSIAQYNGWSPELDTTIPFNKTIDEIFNPISLAERASSAYNVIRSRNDLLNNNKDKFPIILNLINNQLKNKKVLIVCKNGNYANELFTYLFDNDIAVGQFHDDIPSSPYFDTAINDYIRYKSGAKKGEIKLFGSKVLSDNWLNRMNLSPSNPNYNEDNINVLIIKNCSSDSLECTLDAVIFVNGLHSNIDEFRYRYKNIKWSTDKDIFYKLFLIGTNEEKEIINSKVKSPREIINENDDKNIPVCFAD